MSSGSPGNSHRIKIPEVFAQNDKEESMKSSFDGKKSISQIIRENSAHRRNNSLAFIREQSKLISSEEQLQNGSYLEGLLSRDESAKNDHITDNPIQPETMKKAPKTTNSTINTPRTPSRYGTPKITPKSSPVSSQSDLQQYIDSLVDSMVAVKLKEMEKKFTEENTLLKSTIEQKLNENHNIIEEVEKKLNKENSLLKSTIEQKFNENHDIIEEVEKKLNKENSLLKSTIEQKFNENHNIIEDKFNDINKTTSQQAVEVVEKTAQQQTELNQRLSENQKLIESQQKLIERIISDSEAQRLQFEEYMALQKQKLEEVISDNQRYLKQNEELKKELDELIIKNQRVDEETASLKDKVGLIESRVDVTREEFENKVNDAEEKIVRLNAIREEFELRVNDAHEEIDKLKSSKMNIQVQQTLQVDQDELDQLKTNMDNNNSELKGIKNQINELVSLENIRYRPNKKVNPDIISAIIPRNIKYLKPNYYKGCSKLKKITFEGEVITNIPSSFCQDCVALQEITLPSSVITIEDNAFKGCLNLTSIDLDNVQTIKPSAFANCGLIEVSIPKVTALEHSAFSDNAKLTKITFGTKLKTIPASTCHNCSSLSAIDIPLNIEFIAIKSFAACGLTEVNVRKAVVQRGAFDSTVKIYKHK